MSREIRELKCCLRFFPHAAEGGEGERAHFLSVPEKKKKGRTGV
jgi:hypothetical protein